MVMDLKKEVETLKNERDQDKKEIETLKIERDRDKATVRNLEESNRTLQEANAQLQEAIRGSVNQTCCPLVRCAKFLMGKP